MTDVLDLHLDLAGEPLAGLAFQCAAAARFLRRGDIGAALQTYERIVNLHREYAAPAMAAIRQATGGKDAMAEAAAQWRESRPAPRKAAVA